MQGQTVGAGQFNEFMVLHYQGVKDENLWSNIAYVGLSRAKGLNNIAIKHRLSQKDWLYIGKSNQATKLRTVVQEMELSAITKRNELSRNNIGTKDDYLDLLHYWLEYIRSKSYVIGNE